MDSALLPETVEVEHRAPASLDDFEHWSVQVTPTYTVTVWKLTYDPARPNRVAVQHTDRTYPQVGVPSTIYVVHTDEHPRLVAQFVAAPLIALMRGDDE